MRALATGVWQFLSPTEAVRGWPLIGEKIYETWQLASTNAAHMLAFSTAADVVKPSQIGTSAAIVNGIMFIVGRIMISRPGVRIGVGIEAGIEPRSLEIAQYASWPLLAALVVALALSFFMKETYPRS